MKHCTMLLAKITFVFYLQAIVVLAADIKRFVVDVDSGVDDYHALVLLIHADNQGLIKLEGIVCTKGNTEVKNVLKNVYRLLETAHRTDIPVYAGSYYEIIPKVVPDVKWFGEDGFADLTFKQQPNVNKTQKQIAPVALNRLFKQNPKQIAVMILGPSTNVALALRLYKSFADSIKEIIIMGGNYEVREAEFNVLADPESTRIVLAAAHCPITLFTWQACTKDPITFSWRFGLKNISNPVWDILERAETKLYTDNSPTDIWMSCDSMTALFAIYPEAITKQSLHNATVALEGNDRGLIILHDENTAPNVNIIERINVDLFKEVFADSFVGICKDRDCSNKFL